MIINLELAARIAKAGTLSNNTKHYSFGCVALRQDGAVVVSTNLPARERQPSCHAESRALKKAGIGAILWVARVTRDGQWALAKPCTTCETFLKNKKAKKVYYTIGPNEYGVLTF